MATNLFNSTKPNISVKVITSKETHIVRSPVLRPGLPIEECVFKSDNLNSTFHLGLKKDNALIGVATFIKENHNLFNTKEQYRLRGMAVLKQEQGNQYGNYLLKNGEKELAKKNIKLLWFNARTVAINFYKRNGFKIIGLPFEIEKIGTHYVMYKEL